MIKIIYATKIYDDTQLRKQMDSQIQREDIHTIIDKDTDVYKEDGTLLLRFRKNILSKEKIDLFNDNVLKFACIPTSNRGAVCGSNTKNVYKNPKVMSNIIGYYDKLSPIQKYKFKQMGIPLPSVTVRETRFTQENPDKFNKTIPLIQEIDSYYEKLIPSKYEKQHAKALQTPFHIADTCFTTVTTNVNFQTMIHKDVGDDNDGFGNLAVIENGDYKGGETCFPQYGIGVDVRTGDVLYMDVHEAHGNLPIILGSPTSKRLSVVCYLRKSIWKQTKGKSQEFKEQQLNTMKKIKN